MQVRQQVKETSIQKNRIRAKLVTNKVKTKLENQGTLN